MKKLMHKYGALIYGVLTMGWSWFWWSQMLKFIEPGELLTNMSPEIYMYVALGGIGPSVMGILCTYLTNGQHGLQQVHVRLSPKGIGVWWWSILIIPTSTLLMPLIRTIAGYDHAFSSTMELVIPGLGLGIAAALMEEFGWRGYLLPQLLTKYTPWQSALIIGLVWGGVWHGYADYFAYGGHGIYMIPMITLLGPVLLTTWSYLMTWAYTNTKGNLLLSLALHASISSSALIFGQQFVTHQEEFVWTAISVTIAILVTVVTIAGSRGLVIAYRKRI